MVVGAEVGRFADAARVDLSLSAVRPCSTVGVGSLPHRNAAEAAEFSLTAFDVLTLPSLPRRSPAEATVAQALVGVAGVTLGQYGALAIDVDRLDPDAPVDTDLWRDTFTGFRTCLSAAGARSYQGVVKWQFAGPITVGLTLLRAGAEPAVAFGLAERVVRSHVSSLASAVADELPNAPQLIVLDEPALGEIMARDFPIAPDEAIDLLSSAMAAVETRGSTGVHCCGDVDLAGLVAAGPAVISIAADEALVAHAGYLQRFVSDGGWVIWGAVPTDGPIGSHASRSTAHLESVWRALAARGCDRSLLRERALISPRCGLAGLNAAVASQVSASVREVAASVGPAPT